MTGGAEHAKGARAPFAAFVGLALLLATLLATPLAAPLRAAETRAQATTADAAHLPRPGAYVLQRIQRMPDAQLLDAEGRAAQLSAYTRGAVTALAFFYAHCVDPAGCPLAWSTFEAVARDANDDPLLKSRLRLVFASLDPEHDTPKVMRLLQSSENEAGGAPWAFLTSRSLNDLSPLVTQMGQDIAFETDQTGRRSGAINHMLKVFLVDPDGWVREIYSAAFLTPENLLNDARTLAMEFPEAVNRLKER
ncbi:SCO family protein [Methylocystis hirsuta]|uniref:SCO family protein n=1 Tax=Methylocystis hirsuta TaxID=369798 RepID=A0A3M9XPQ0_9HYPH|nr:SCO family protein [Methylocystis hirsuta]RNJ49058.1 SCO family protein [Methylocystis hirsuta]